MTGQLSWKAPREPAQWVAEASRGLHHLLRRVWPDFAAARTTRTIGLAQAGFAAVALTAAMTLCLFGVTRVVELRHISIAYLIPVLATAISVGVAPAILAAVCGVAASAYFFYPPIWDLRISDPQHVLDVILFIVVATVAGKLASSARAHAVLAEDRERAMRMLYAFSKRLAVATEETHIYAAIEDHLSSITGCPVAYYAPGARFSPGGNAGSAVPAPVASAIRDLVEDGGANGSPRADDGRLDARWLIRAVSRAGAAFGSVAVDIGNVPIQERAGVGQRIDAALSDAIDTLERLDMARVIGQAKLRAEAETLRTALIGSVSHGLRTPLASIMGSASILVQAPCIVADPRLMALAGIVREEADTLNRDIQKLLDASRISAAGVRAHTAWADPADIVNAAVERRHGRAGGDRILVELSEDLPLLHIDAVLIEQALSLVLDNAVKYSAAGTTVRIGASTDRRGVAISVRDEGAGLSAEERGQMFERFYRGPRTRDRASGSGLGLWIANAFVAACGGRIEAASEGVGRGATVTIHLPQTDAHAQAPGSDADG